MTFLWSLLTCAWTRWGSICCWNIGNTVIMISFWDIKHPTLLLSRWTREIKWEWTPPTWIPNMKLVHWKIMKIVQKKKEATRVEKKVILPQQSTSQVIFGFQDARHKPLQILSGQMKQIKLHRLSNCSQVNQYSSCVKLIPFTKSSPTAMVDMSIIIA